MTSGVADTWRAGVVLVSLLAALVMVGLLGPGCKRVTRMEGRVAVPVVNVPLTVTPKPRVVKTYVEEREGKRPAGNAWKCEGDECRAVQCPRVVWE